MFDLQKVLDSIYARNPGIKCDRDIDRAMGQKGANVCHWRAGRTLPSDDVMPALCALAGLDLETALAQLNAARAKHPEVKAAYSRIAAKLSTVACALAVLLTTALITFAAPARAAGTEAAHLHLSASGDIHYATKRRRRWRELMRYFRCFFTVPALA